MSTEKETAFREQIVHSMRGDESQIDFDSAVKDFPMELAGRKPGGVPHSAWQLLEHMRIAQQDILEFSRNPKHQSPKWPDEYWPVTEEPPSEDAWKKSVAEFKRDLAVFEELVRDKKRDLLEAIEGGSGQTLLREALLVATHNSYHLGQLVFLQRALAETSVE